MLEACADGGVWLCTVNNADDSQLGQLLRIHPEDETVIEGGTHVPGMIC